MQTLEHIQQQIRNLPHRYVFYTKKEIRYLPEILGHDEKILALTSGYMHGNTWLCVCTNQRLLFIDRGIIFGLRQVQMNLDRIQSIDATSAIFFGAIRVWDGGILHTGSHGAEIIYPAFIRTVQEAIDHYKRMMVHSLAHNVENAYNAVNTVKQSAPERDNNDWIKELERLSALHKAGHLNEKEFQTAKRKLLAEHSA